MPQPHERQAPCKPCPISSLLLKCNCSSKTHLSCRSGMFASTRIHVLGKSRVAAKRGFGLRFEHVRVDRVFWLRDAAPTGKSRASLSSWKLPVYPELQGMECRSKFQQGSPFQHGLSWVPAFAHFSRAEVCSLPDQLRLILP